MASERAVFYFDLASPWAWIAAERVNTLFDLPPVWQPVAPDPVAEPGAGERREIERAAAEAGLLPLRWPDPWPGEVDAAMRTATFAKQGGRAVAFALAAFRQAFAAGRDLSVVDNVLIAAAACELHPRAVLKGIETKAVREELARATAEARERGVTSTPAVVDGGELLTLDRLLLAPG